MTSSSEETDGDMAFAWTHTRGQSKQPIVSLKRTEAKPEEKKPPTIDDVDKAGDVGYEMQVDATKAFTEENWKAAERRASAEHGGRASEVSGDGPRSSPREEELEGASPLVLVPRKEHQWKSRQSRSMTRRRLKLIAAKVEASPAASSSSGIKRNYDGAEVGSEGLPLVSPRTQLAEDLTAKLRM